jgi:hypothetical protein
VSSNLTERQGVEPVRAKIVTDLGWYPREPERPDYGVDLYVECAEEGVPTGRLFGMQIKSGDSYFREETDAGFIFRGDSRHLEYWTRHSLPVILVLYDLRDHVAYWTTVTDDLVESTGAGWKIVVPRESRLDASAREALALLADGDPYVLALRRLRSDRTWMTHLARGGRVLLEAEEWVNKTSGRGEVRLVAESASGEPERDVSWMIFAPFRSYEEVLPQLFPWADLSLDESVYEDADEAAWDLDCGIWDSEDQRYVHTQTFSEWCARRDARSDTDLRPYEEDGEIARWKLELSLNSLGEGFLTVDDYLSKSEPE